MNTACVDCWLPVTSDTVCILWKCHAAVCCKRYVVSGLVSIACVCLCTYMHVFGGIIYHFSLFSWCKLHSIQLGVKSPPLDHWSAHIAVSRCGIAPVGWLRIQPSCLQDVLNYQIKIPAGKSHTCDVPFYRALTLPVFPLYKDFLIWLTSCALLVIPITILSPLLHHFCSTCKVGVSSRQPDTIYECVMCFPDFRITPFLSLLLIAWLHHSLVGTWAGVVPCLPFIASNITSSLLISSW